jgi:hypothetical protein
MMNCPHCGRPVSEPRACKDCLPFNLYANQDVIDAYGWDNLHAMTMSQLDKLRTLDYRELQWKDPKSKVAVLEARDQGRTLVFVPIVDEGGEKAVMIGFKDGVRDGWHRVRFSLN